MSWQVALTKYLDAEFCHSAGDYGAALKRLDGADRAAPVAPSAAASVVPSTFDDIVEVARVLNERLLHGRNTVGVDNRHPQAPRDLLHVNAAHEYDLVYDFYSVALEALEPGVAEGTTLWKIRTAILLDGVRDHDVARLLSRRFRERRRLAESVLRLGRTGGNSNVTINAMADAGVDGGGAIPAFVLKAFVQAHINRYNVEHGRSVAVGAVLRTNNQKIGEATDLLEQSVALLTFSFAVCLVLPWVFAADPAERTGIVKSPKTARDRISPRRPLWLAKQVALLSIYRRAHVFRLLGQHERSYNDLRKVQRIGRLTHIGLRPNDSRRRSLNALEALAEFRIGELYRADHDAGQALSHLCHAHDLVISRRQDAGIVNDSALFQLHIRLSKGKAFLEVGAVKRALKWFIRAWMSLCALVGLEEEPAEVKALDTYLDGIRHGPEVDKRELVKRLKPAVTAICSADVPETHAALTADILTRIAHVLLVLRLGRRGRSTDAEKLLKLAASLDSHNLLVWFGLLRCELRGMARWDEVETPNPLECWPSGATDVDQAIRAGEYLMLERLRDVEGEPGSASDEPDEKVARALLKHFHTHTDSINLRLGILHRYLMKRRWDEDHDENSSGLYRRPSGEPSLEFVCLRRYGSYTPFMPRPASVSALGGGYLVRIFSPNARTTSGEAPPRLLFNILVDPGDSVVNNLYRAGLAISDIDMIVATHDHPDHLASLDAILSLRHEHRERLRRMGEDPDAQAAPGAERMLILGNRSVVNRYSFLNGSQEYVVQHIDDATAQQCPQITARGIEVTALPTQHEDLGKDHAVGFLLTFNPQGPEQQPNSATSGSPPGLLRIAFMSDTAVQGLGDYKNRQLTEMHPVWTKALESDITVAHMSDTPSGELRDLAGLTQDEPARHVKSFDETVEALLGERPDDAMQLMHALSLIDQRKPAHRMGLLENGFVETMEGWGHLYLHGLLAVSREMAKLDDGRQRVLVIGELREQLGSLRGTIAREINDQVFRPGDSGSVGEEGLRKPVALTADIGLRISLRGPQGVRVYCSTCALNNDRLAEERYHSPLAIREVCVKGDHEAMYWNCGRHDPSNREPPVFVEHIGSYDPFATGGRFHG